MNFQMELFSSLITYHENLSYKNRNFSKSVLSEGQFFKTGHFSFKAHSYPPTFF